MRNKVKIESTEKKKVKKPKKKNGFSKLINSILNGEFLTREGFVKHLPYVAFLTFLFIVFIGIDYYYENTLRDLSKYQRKLENVKHEYNTTLSRLETLKLESQLINDAQNLGLNKSIEQPKIIQVEKGYFEKK